MRFTYLIPLGLLAAAVGCQGGADVNAPSPAPQGSVTPRSALTTYTPAVAQVGGGINAPAYEGTMGGWTLSYRDRSATLEPLRSAAATPGIGTYDVDVTDAFTRTFCGGCLEVESVTVDGNGRPVVGLAATHPFALGNPGNPPTATNRNDLFIFNLKGILVAEATPETIGGTTVSGDLLEDPDGYYPHQGLFPTGTTTADAFPYMVFGVDESVTGIGNFDNATGQWIDMADPSGFNVMGQGQTVRAAYTLDVDPGESRDFSLVLVARYGQSVTGRATRLTPTYYPAEFASDPWRVVVNEPALPYDSTPTNFQLITVDVNDFAVAHGAEDPGYPSSNYLGLSWAPIVTAEMTIPGFSATQFDPTGPPTGTGAIGDPLVFPFSVNNALGAPNGTYTALVKVSSNRPVGTAGPADPDDVNGIKASLDPLDLVSFTEIATYQVFSLQVQAVVGQPPVADLASSKTEVMQGNGAYFFPGPGTTDPDGTVTEYQYDFDYDGATFTPNATSPDADPVSGRFPNVGTTVVAMRVKDNDNNLSNIDTLNMTVVAPGDPFPPTNPMNSFNADASIEMFRSSDHQVIAYDHNFPGNVYLLADANQTSTDEYRIYRSKDFGRTFDGGTPIEAQIKSYPGANFGWISGHGLTVLADGSLGFLFNTSDTAAIQGRGVYYVWIDADPYGTGVNPGGGTHKPVRVNGANGTFDVYGDPGIWADPSDPTLADVTMQFNPTGADGVFFCNVFAANTNNPNTQESTVVSIAEGLTIDDVHSHMDRSTGDMHMVWEEFLTSTDRWIGYTRIHINNPVGPRARISAMTTLGAIVAWENPTVSITTNGQAVVSWAADFDITAASDYDIVLAKINDNGSGVQTFVTPITRLTMPGVGQNNPFILGDRQTGRLSLAFQSGGTTAVSGNRDMMYTLYDASLNQIMGAPQSLQTVDPGVTYPHDDPWGAIDENTGEVINVWLEEPAVVASEKMAWRYSR